MLQKYEKIAELLTKKQFFLTFLCLLLFTQAQIFAQNGHSITIQKANISVVDALKKELPQRLFSSLWDMLITPQQ